MHALTRAYEYAYTHAIDTCRYVCTLHMHMREKDSQSERERARVLACV
jgi:hypothetical protein